MFEHITKQIKLLNTAFALDLETTGLDHLLDSILGIAIAVGDYAWYIELPKRDEDSDEHQRVFDQFKLEFRAILSDPTLLMVLHNAKFDLSFLHTYGVSPKNSIADTMIASHMVDENTGNGLKECAMREFGHKMTTYAEVSGGLFSQDMGEYAEDDARQTLRLWHHYKPILEEEGMLEGFFNIEMPTIKVVMEMENTGVRIDTMLLLKFAKELKERVALCENRIFGYAGMPFDIGSPKQLSGILFGRLHFNSEGLEEGKNKCFPTDGDTLEEFKDKAPIVKYILDWRRYSKISTTYIKPILEHINPLTERIHSKFWQTGTRTGRFSSSSPINLQNIVNDDKYKVRAAFIAAPGNKLIVADYSQIELRLLAHASQETMLLNVYRMNGDIHQETADLIGCTRRAAKTINFGLLYGMGPAKLAKTLKISEAEARKFMSTYFEKLPNIRGYISATQEVVRYQKWVRTLITGRRRRFTEIDGRAERQGVNFIIQGCLQKHVRVLTDHGYLPIGELYNMNTEGWKVWTGTNWATFEVLNRGKAKLATLLTYDGRKLDCDTRHEVLTHTMRRHTSFSGVVTLPKQKRICSMHAKALDFISKPLPKMVKRNTKAANNYKDFILPEKYEAKLFYWLGRYVGDGWVSLEHTTFGICFGRHEEYHAKRFSKFLSKCGIHTTIRFLTNDIGGRSISVSAHSKSLVRYLVEICGVCEKATAHTKKLPNVVWQASLCNRRLFLKGVIDSDGCKRFKNIHLVNGNMLRELQLIFDITYKNKTSVTGGPSRKCGTYTLNYGITGKTGCVRLHPDYSFSNFKSLEVEECEEETYTLSVHDPKHQYVSEGIISKNTAADLMKKALGDMHEAFLSRKKYKDVRLLMTIHDEVVVEASEKVVEGAAKIVRDCMDNAWEFTVPTPCTLEICNSWDEGK